MIRTTEDLIDRIAADRAWRIREIAEMRNLVESNDISQIRKKVLCRAGVALLYAHWEGFVKKCGTYFLQYVSYQRLPVSELRVNFVTLVLKARLDRAAATANASALDEIVEYLLMKSASRARVPHKNVVDTRSNLSSNVLKEISWSLGIPYMHFEAKEKLIDFKLLNRRNYVAHGEGLPIDDDDFIEMSGEVIELINLFRNEVENSAVQRLFKRPPSEVPS